MAECDASQEVQRAKWRMYSQASYERNKEERCRRMREAYYHRTGRTPKDFAKLIITA